MWQLGRRPLIGITLSTVRAELVEAPFFLFGLARKEQPFDKHRACPPPKGGGGRTGMCDAALTHAALSKGCGDSGFGGPLRSFRHRSGLLKRNLHTPYRPEKAQVRKKRM